MPQIVKGGKYIFGWSRVSKNGEIKINNEAMIEYDFNIGDKVILLPGSSYSEGFGIKSIKRIKKSKLKDILENNPTLVNFMVNMGDTILYKDKYLSWTKINENNSIKLPLETLSKYEITPEMKLLSVRGSWLSLGFVAKGRLIEEAKNTQKLKYSNKN
ncbi:MAG: hypothetical protein GF329_01365 [Candidatus Lokiarchaeota archaeon]|nr:hypothetical protein [Candidatus Lokiarchaeota archaeon]